MMDKCTHHKLEQDLIETECTEWLLLFLELIDFNDQKATVYLELFLKSRFNVLKVKSCHQRIVDYVSTKLLFQLQHLVCIRIGSLCIKFSYCTVIKSGQTMIMNQRMIL